MGNATLYVFLFGFVQICVGLHMRADFDQKDIRGYVKFGQHNSSLDLTIEFQLRTDLRSLRNISFKVTKGPSIYEDFCKNVGGVIHDFTTAHGYVTHNSTFTDSTVNIVGKESVFGNSLSLYENGSVIACSTILPHRKVSYATANIFSNTVGGSFNFIQPQIANANADTFVYGSIQDNGGKITTRNYSVYISADTANHATCDPLNQIYNPTDKSGSCTKMQEGACKIGDLSSKHGVLSVGKDAQGLLQGVDIKLPLQGSYSIVSRYVVIKKAGTIVGCGKIKIAGPLEVISIFNEKSHKGISGYLKFSQQSPYHFTKFKTELKGLAKRAKSYHVHRFPISDDKYPCSASSVGGHVNTWKVNIADSPKPNEGSLDKYEVGDLSGRYGTLVGEESYSHDTDDANLPLYGLHTILGRSIVIHHQKDNSRFVCSNIEPESYKLKVESLANFSAVEGSPVSGTVHSMQYVQANGIITRTISIVDLKHKNEPESIGHKWTMQRGSVHENKCPKKDSVNNPIYNPVNVTDDFCSETNPFLCPIGHLSGKVGMYDFKLGKTFFSDENLPMFGEMTSLGRSIVFYKRNASDEVLACANIGPLPGKSVSKLEFKVQNPKLKDDLAQLKNTLLLAFGFQAAEKFRINSLKTSLIADNDECFGVEFYMIDTNKPPNAGYYRCALDDILKSPGKMDSYKVCAPKSSSIIIVPSVVLLVLSTIISVLL